MIVDRALGISDSRRCTRSKMTSDIVYPQQLFQFGWRFQMELNGGNAANQKWTYLYVHAPPATVFLQDPQCQIPTALLFILVWKYKFTTLITVAKQHLVQTQHPNTPVQEGRHCSTSVHALNRNNFCTTRWIHLGFQWVSLPCHRKSRCI